jgi:heavy metal translocating P-type ATPase
VSDQLTLDVEGMTCASCVGRVERALLEVPGVRAATVNLAARTATVEADAVEIAPFVRAIESVGYGAGPHRQERAPGDEARAYRARLVLAAPLTLAVLVLTFVVPRWGPGMWLAWALATPVQFVAGWPFLRNAWRSARHRAATMDTLIAIGSLAAYLVSAWNVLAGVGRMGPVEHYFDTGAVIVTLILLGKLLEARARSSAGDAARALLERGARTAAVLEPDGSVRRIPIGELRPGMTAVVLPGEKVPADGVVRRGVSWVDLSLLTGESAPVDVGLGDEVVGASINGAGRLEMLVTTVGEHSRLGEIVRLVRQAQGSKAPIQRLADRVSAVFVPVVLLLALATFAGWAWWGDDRGAAALHAIAVLLIACPCALGLATPAAIMAGTGRAAESGVLFGGGEVFEAARDVDTVVLDKTGTVTTGVMQVARVIPTPGLEPDAVLALAAAAESGSEHPIARAVGAAARARGLRVPASDGHEVLPGAGAVAWVGGEEIRVGRPQELGVELEDAVETAAAAGLTPFAVRRGGAPIGLVAVGDEVRTEAPAAVAALRSMGLEVVMATGDRRATAEAIARRVGIDHVEAEAFPGDKVALVRGLQARGRRVVFVGDGLNDAPALAEAAIGVAVGTGTDVAMAAADVRLLGDSLLGVPGAIGLARRTYRVIAQNLAWAFGYNVVMIPLAVGGVLEPVWAAAAMAASSVSVVLNALRLRGRRNRAASPGVVDPVSGADTEPVVERA